MHRESTRPVRIGDVTIGGGAPIAVQSMTNTRTADVDATVRQILALAEAGCEIIRCAVPTMEDAEAIGRIRSQIPIPLVADIHFDWRLAIASIENGADKIRINPGNIGGEDRVRAVVDCAKEHGIPIRIGVNGGSLDPEIRDRLGGVNAASLAESAIKETRLVESLGYDNLVLSIKSSNVPLAIEAHRLVAEELSYPIHVGITEAGTPYQGIIKSAAGIGAILSLGIGDTVRVSLTGDPVEEVRAAREILKSMELRTFGPTIISCPTCGRTSIDLIGLAEQVTERTQDLTIPVKIAVMGCVVNGPGEAKEADFGVAGGDGKGVLFRRGEIVRTMPEEELLPALMEELARYKAEEI